MRRRRARRRLTLQVGAAQRARRTRRRRARPRGGGFGGCETRLRGDGGGVDARRARSISRTSRCCTGNPSRGRAPKTSWRRWWSAPTSRWITSTNPSATGARCKISSGQSRRGFQAVETVLPRAPRASPRRRQVGPPVGVTHWRGGRGGSRRRALVAVALFHDAHREACHAIFGHHGAENRAESPHRRRGAVRARGEGGAGGFSARVRRGG